ncbi:MAG: N-acetylglutaminylglutamine amidotransferase [Pseudomonadota bacterium]|nr:N-acetylglutaminylglutamine amidotransferase [Pseudomonadota bacterium]
MCGICGEIRFDNRGVNRETSKRMVETIARRGPDNEGLFFHNQIFLGHRRLSIIDVTEKSHQPMTDHSLNLTIVFNGVIYNYKELRNRLKKEGYSFFSDGDTEVILKSYHFYGEECVNHFDGVFAFCIYDTNKQTFFISRDRLGIKPLYYTLNDNFFRFSSNTKSLINSQNNQIEIDKTSLHYQFTLHSVVPAPKTIIKNINKLEPGHNLTITLDGKTENKKYYSFNHINLDSSIKEEDALEEIERLIALSIKKRLNTSDVPVGVLLSGGLDSSLITAIAAKHCNSNINTFSIGFPSIENEGGDEFHFSDKIVEQFNTSHQKIFLSEDELFENLDEVISCMPEPMASQDASAFFLLGKEVSKTQKVVLSGQGADELFGGYFWYEKMEKLESSNLRKFSMNYFDRDHTDFCKTISETLCSDNYSSALIKSLFEKQNTNLSFLDKVLRIDLSTLIIDDPVKRVDSMTMSWGLETRVPFLDISLVEFMLQIPSELKIMNGGKHHLKKIAKKFFTDEFINREKFYFPVPPLKIVQNKFLDYMKDILLSDSCTKRGVFNSKNIETLLRNPNKHLTKLNGNKLWHLALFERWFQINVDEINTII